MGSINVKQSLIYTCISLVFLELDVSLLKMIVYCVRITPVFGTEKLEINVRYKRVLSISVWPYLNHVPRKYFKCTENKSDQCKTASKKSESAIRNFNGL